MFCSVFILGWGMLACGGMAVWSCMWNLGISLNHDECTAQSTVLQMNQLCVELILFILTLHPNHHPRPPPVELKFAWQIAMWGSCEGIRDESESSITGAGLGVHKDVVRPWSASLISCHLARLSSAAAWLCGFYFHLWPATFHLLQTIPLTAAQLSRMMMLMFPRQLISRHREKYILTSVVLPDVLPFSHLYIFFHSGLFRLVFIDNWKKSKSVFLIIWSVSCLVQTNKIN